MVFSLVKPLKTKEKVLATFETEKEVVSYIKDNDLTWSFPYMFTYVGLSNGLIVKQFFRGFIVSPEELRKELEK